jgi:hypothetical protein
MSDNLELPINNNNLQIKSEEKCILVSGIPLLLPKPSPQPSTTVFASTEVQSHGFGWEKEILQIYGATLDELSKIPYTSKVDLPFHLNRLNMCNISVKTTKSLNTICMADCLRLFDSINNTTTTTLAKPPPPLHLVVMTYNQNTPNTKQISQIIEVDLTNSSELLFGKLTRNKIFELDNLIKQVPNNRKPTKEEHIQMYNMRSQLQELSGAIYLNIKCNSQQSRLQCSFNKFQHFIDNNPTRVIAKSNNNEFYCGKISSSIISLPRKFNK